MLLLFLGMILVLFTCFSARKAKKTTMNGGRHDGAGYDNRYGDGNGYATPNTAPMRKKKFGIF